MSMPYEPMRSRFCTIIIAKSRPMKFVMGFRFGFELFFSSILQDALNEDVHHVDVLSRLGDVHVAFGILFQCFT
jgi:hypothetical protein